MRFLTALPTFVQRARHKLLTYLSPLNISFAAMEAPPRFELGVRVLQTHALPLGYSAERNKPFYRFIFYGADYEARTRYLHLGKVALYQMS